MLFACFYGFLRLCFWAGAKITFAYVDAFQKYVRPRIEVEAIQKYIAEHPVEKPVQQSPIEEMAEHNQILNQEERLRRFMETCKREREQFVAKKEKADVLLSEKIKEMERIKSPLEKNKKELLECRTKLNSIIKNNFEIIVSVCFKHLSNYYQCLFLILNQRIELLINLREKIDDILTQLYNLVFDLNDFSERKFGESVLNIKTEGLNINFSGDLINKSSMKQLIELSINIINYSKIFLTCLRYRKKIMKFFYEILSQVIDFETNNIKQFNENKKNFMNQLDKLRLINNNCLRFLQNLISKEKNNEIIIEINSIISVINNYIEFARNEYNTFFKNWESYEEKIMERQKLSIDFLNEMNELKNSNKSINQTEFINRNEKKKRKLKNAILAGLDFIQKNVISTREKDKNEMMKLESTFEKIFNNR